MSSTLLFKGLVFLVAPLVGYLAWKFFSLFGGYGGFDRKRDKQPPNPNDDPNPPTQL